MRTLLHRLLGLARARGFDTAGEGRRCEGARTVDGLNAAILAGATTAARRAGWYARNNSWVAAAVGHLRKLPVVAPLGRLTGMQR